MSCSVRRRYALAALMWARHRSIRVHAAWLKAQMVSFSGGCQSTIAIGTIDAMKRGYRLCYSSAMLSFSCISSIHIEVKDRKKKIAATFREVMRYRRRELGSCPIYGTACISEIVLFIALRPCIQALIPPQAYVLGTRCRIIARGRTHVALSMMKVSGSDNV